MDNYYSYIVKWSFCINMENKGGKLFNLFEFLGRDNVMIEDDYEAMHRKVMDGELACFGGPTELSYYHAKYPENIPVTNGMIENLRKKCGLS